MTDLELRQVERALQVEPASLDLRRQHARLLLRAGDEERALSALDLAWRLGADDLWDELRTLLVARRVEVGVTTFAWIPGGPFAMGADDLDEDVAPAHLVTLPGYYIALAPLRWGALEGFSGFPAWASASQPDREPWAERFRQNPFVSSHDRAQKALKFLNQRTPPPGGLRWALPGEAQWERALRAAYLRPDGRSPYGVEPGDRCEWTADAYETDAYSHEPRRGKPRGAQPALHAVRGVPGLPPPHHALYREAADDGGRFLLDDSRQTLAATEEGIVARPVLVAGPP